MTSKLKIDVAKIKEERKQYASKLEQYNKCKLKSRRISQAIKFDELKKFKGLESQLANEPSIPVEEYGDPVGMKVLDPEQYQCLWNISSAYKKTVHRKGQSCLKISNILKFNDYDKEEKKSMGQDLLYLMSVSPENTSDCVNILDQWVFEWQPTFLQICIMIENLGLDVGKELTKDYHFPNHYQAALESTKLGYNDFNSKASSTKQTELNSDCLKNVLKYLKSVVGYFEKNEVQSLLIILSALSLDKNCMGFKEAFNDLLNKCFGCLESADTDKILHTLYTKIENSMYQCYFVNKILNPCNSDTKTFTIQLSYLFMCNLLYNHELVFLNTSLNISDNNNQSDVALCQTKCENKKPMNLRSKRKLEQIPETRSSPKKLILGNEKSKSSSPKKWPLLKEKATIETRSSPQKLQLAREKSSSSSHKKLELGTQKSKSSSPKKLELGKAKEKLSLEKENSKLHNTKPIMKPTRKKGKSKIDAAQKSLLDYWKVREKSPDLSSVSSLTSKTKGNSVLDKGETSNATITLDLNPIETKVDLTETKVQTENTEDTLVNGNQDTKFKQESNCIDLTDQPDDPDDDVNPIDETLLVNCDQREIIFRKHKTTSVTFHRLYQRVRYSLQEHLNCPIRIYRTVNLLNNIVQLLVIDETNMPIVKLIMQELSHIQYKYYGLHDIHRHLVCMYLQQYTTIWGTHINLIRYRIDRRNEEEGDDSE
ncbi:hypothetical protein WDU94_007169 [Cyamophila willieti]